MNNTSKSWITLNINIKIRFWIHTWNLNDVIMTSLWRHVFHFNVFWAFLLWINSKIILLTFMQVEKNNRYAAEVIWGQEQFYLIFYNCISLEWDGNFCRQWLIIEGQNCWHYVCGGSMLSVGGIGDIQSGSRNVLTNRKEVFSFTRILIEYC